MKEKESRAFRMHKDLLWSVIQSQSGTFEKALLELVMNAVDANATEVCIQFDGKTRPALFFLPGRYPARLFRGRAGQRRHV